MMYWPNLLCKRNYCRQLSQNCHKSLFVLTANNFFSCSYSKRALNIVCFNLFAGCKVITIHLASMMAQIAKLKLLRKL